MGWKILAATEHKFLPLEDEGYVLECSEKGKQFVSHEFLNKHRLEFCPLCGEKIE